MAKANVRELVVRQLVCAAALVLALGGAACAEMLRGYHIGNSLTNDARVTSVQSSLTANGKTAFVGYHIDSAQSAHSISLIPSGAGGLDARPPAPFGAWDNALPNYVWDYVAIQSYNKWNEHPPNISVTGEEELSGYRTMMSAARLNPENADARLYIYQAWPQTSDSLSYRQLWDKAYSALSLPMAFRKQYFTLLYDELKRDAANTFIIPAGEVFARLDDILRGNPIDGRDSAYGLYRDRYHMGNNRRYVAHMTTLATILRQDPTTIVLTSSISGLPSSAAFKALADEVIWDTVRSMPETGVVPEPGTIALVGAGLAGVLMRHVSRSR
jgi:hypothetical protein